MGNYRFEKMNEHHLQAVQQIYSHYVQNTTATFHTQLPTPDQMRKIVFSDNEKYKTFVILAADEVCGYVLTARHKNREAYDKTAEVSIYLHPAFTGKGIGSLALIHIEAFARQQKLHVLVATICGENQPSIRLFARNGYEKCAHYKQVGEKFGQLLDIVAYQKILA